MSVLTATSSTEFLSVSAVADLIADAQAVPVTVVVDEDDTERTVYGSTSASEAALAALTSAFMPAIRKAAYSAKVIDRDEAEGVALLAFIEAVRAFEPRDEVPFSATISQRLVYAVKRADRGNDLIRVKNTVAAAYWALMFKYSNDFTMAYASVKIAGNGLAPHTFLAVHVIMSGIDTIDPILSSEDSESGPRHALASAVASHEDGIAAAEEIAYLFTLVTDEEATVLRLAYGFRDDATENVRVAAGFKGGEILSDQEISGTTAVPGMGRATVNRRRLSGIAKMRAGLEAAAND